jgi:hypothetical protein
VARYELGWKVAATNSKGEEQLTKKTFRTRAEALEYKKHFRIARVVKNKKTR